MDFPSLNVYTGQSLLPFPHIKAVVDQYSSELLASQERNDICLTVDKDIWAINRAEGCLSQRTGGGQWTNHPYNPLAMTVDQQGTISLCERYKVIQYRDNVFTPLPLPEHLRFRDVWADTGGLLWIEGEQELIKYTEQTVTVLPFPPDNSTQTIFYQWYPVSDFFQVSSMAADAQNQLWIGSNDGLYCQVDSEVIQLKHKNPLPTASIIKVVVDTRDQLWAIHNFGASLLKKDKWRHYTIKDGLISNLLSDAIVTRDSCLWFCSSYGVSRYDGRNWKNFITFGQISYPNIQCITQDTNGTIWLGTFKGVLCYQNNAWSQLGRKNGLPSDSVFALGVDARNTIWIGTPGGLVSYRDNAVLKEFPNLSCDSGSRFVTDHQGNLWLLQHPPQGQTRFLKYTYDTWTEHFKELTKLAVAFTPDNLLYIGSEGGLFMIQNY
jgi:ligand-binding sensor domain-containing protein